MRDSDRPMTQREAYQRGYAAGYAAAQSGPPREPTREMIDGAYTEQQKAGVHPILYEEVWRAMWDAAQINEGGQDAATREDTGPVASGLLNPAPPSPAQGAAACCSDDPSNPEWNRVAARPSPPPDAALVGWLRAWAAGELSHAPQYQRHHLGYQAADAIERLTSELAERTRERDGAHADFTRATELLDVARSNNQHNAERFVRKRIEWREQMSRAERAEAERDTLAAIVRAADAMRTVYATDGCECSNCAKAREYDRARAKVKVTL